MNKFSLLFIFAPLLAQADVYVPNLTDFKFERIVLILDWDKVIATEKGPVGKLFAGMGSVPLNKSLPILFNRGGKIANIMKEARHDGQPLKGLAANIDYMITLEPSLKPYRARLMEKLNEAKPLKEMIMLYQELQAQGIPVIIATNNDYESLVIKTRKLNKNLAKKRIPSFKYTACYCGGSCPNIKNNKAPNGMPAGSVWLGKDSDEYFVKLFAMIEDELGYNRQDTLFVFVDDLDKNIERARRVAIQEGVKLCAVHKNRSCKKIVGEMKNLFSTIKQ